MAPVAAPAALPQGAGCGPAIARTQAVVSADVASGDLNKPVGARFGADLDRAAAACAAGRDGEALHLLAAAKSRYAIRRAAPSGSGPGRFVRSRQAARRSPRHSSPATARARPSSAALKATTAGQPPWVQNRPPAEPRQLEPR